jgi:hypothetical protein
VTVGDLCLCLNFFNVVIFVRFMVFMSVGSMLRRRRSSREKRLKMCEQVSSDSYQKGKSYKG